MGLDYYGILSLKKCATLEEIQKAFRRLMIKFYPGDEQMMCLVAEAYEVLSDTCIRTLYDKLGEENLKAGLLAQPYVFHGQPLKTIEGDVAILKTEGVENNIILYQKSQFQMNFTAKCQGRRCGTIKFFGSLNPFELLVSKSNSSLPLNQNVLASGLRKKDPPIFRNLPLTLEEVFYGGVKKLLIRRLEFVDSKEDQVCQRERILSIPFEPGVMPGTQIVFKEQGDQSPTSLPADIIVVIQDRPHERFIRSGSDLIRKHNLSLMHSLKGIIIKIHTVDKRVLHIRLCPPIRPECAKIVEGEGLPIPGDPKTRGDLSIQFDVQLPTSLPKSVKDAMLAAMIQAEAEERAQNKERAQNEGGSGDKDEIEERKTDQEKEAMKETTEAGKIDHKKGTAKITTEEPCNL